MKKKLYFDMDGILADFDNEPNALTRFKKEKGFFATLQPIEENIKAVKKLIAEGKKVYILSVSPNRQADTDKKSWLKKYLPEVKEKNIYIIRTGTPKNKAVKVKRAILFDDYRLNVRKWIDAGGYLAIKITQRTDKKLKAEYQARTLEQSISRLKMFGVIQ